MRIDKIVSTSQPGRLRAILCVAVLALATGECRIVSAISLDMVTVGNAGNAANTTGYGAVSYDYQIGKYEVTIGQWVEFLNATAKSDPHGLYSSSMTGPNLISAGITRSGSDGSYAYSVMDNPPGQSSANHPITYVSFYDAARFANWLHNGQGLGSTETGAYRLSSGDLVAATRSGGVSTYTTSGPTTLAIGDQVSITGFTNGGSLGTRFNVTGVVTSLPSANQFTMANTNGDAVADGVGSFNGVSSSHAANAKYWLPTEDEWYKAAYYGSALNGGSGGYYLYATQSDSPPGQTMGSSPNQANWNVGNVYAVGPTPLNTSANYLANVGAYSGSPSPYGAFDMTGNVREWTAEITGNSLNSPGSARMWRGGGYNDGESRSTSSYRDSSPNAADAELSSLGFRLAAPVAGLHGDYNANGVVDAADYIIWRNSLGQSGSGLAADGDGDLTIDQDDYTVWRTNFASSAPAFATAVVPEPAAFGLLVVIGITTISGRSLSTRKNRSIS